MTIRSFQLLQPRSLQEAADMLHRHGDEARPIGGGTTLIILLKQRAVHYPFLVDLQTIPGLGGITREDGGVRIGALATHREVECSTVVRQSFPILAEAFSRIGNVRVRQTASVGGNLAHADYRLDPPPPLLVLGAGITAFGRGGTRMLPVEHFFRGLYETALEPGEIIVDVRVPAPPPDARTVYLRFSSLSANDWPCLGVAALLREDNGRCKELRLALGGVGETPLLVGGLDFVKGLPLARLAGEELFQTIDSQISPSADFRGSEWYKRRMVKVFVEKALAQLTQNGI